MKRRPGGVGERSAPAVSVVVPTWNRLELLPRTVESVLGQTFDDLELLVVDDGSTDGTPRYLDSIIDPRLRRVSLPHTGNVARVRNAGARAARGRLLCFLDSDDLWLPEKLAVQVAAMERAGARWSYTRYQHVDESGVSVPARAGQWRPLSGSVALELLTDHASVALATVLVDRETFEALGGFEERALIREDFELLVRLALKADALAIPDCLASVRIHSRRATRGWRGAKPFVVAAATYETVLESLVDPELRRAARRQRGRYLADAAAAHLHDRSVRLAATALLRAARFGASPRHLASAVRRGLGLDRKLLRRLLRPVLGRETRGWLALRSPRLRFLCFGDPVDCVIYGLILARRRVQFIQIGSNDGVVHDPLWTFRRYSKWSGILVEPLDHVFQRLSRNYAPWRDRFVLEQVAVAASSGVRRFYHFPKALAAAPGSDQVGSLDPAHVRKHAPFFGPVAHVVSTPVRCVTVRELCEEHDLLAPDLVHVDAEGLDAEIIGQLDLEHAPPAVLLYEHVHLEHEERQALAARLDRTGYRRLEIRGDTLAVAGAALRDLSPLRSAWHLAVSTLFTARPSP